MRVTEGLTFDDVLLVPKRSNIKSRSDIDTSVDWGKGIKLSIPIVSANMKHVTGPLMARTMASLGGLALLHRFEPIDDQVASYRQAVIDEQTFRNFIGVSIGVNDRNDARSLLERTESRIVCVDVAHGHSESCIETVKWLAEDYPHLFIIAGNVATSDAAITLYRAGADVIKVGIGPGSLCSTRIETGNGVPQLTALSEIKERWPFMRLIADGGIRTAGDLVKALCFADVVMLGNLLAGTDESPGTPVTLIDGKSYKNYAGSSTFKTNHVEGVEKLVPCTGGAKQIIEKLLQGLRSGMSYQGSRNLAVLKQSPQFVRITNNGLIESHPRVG